MKEAMALLGALGAGALLMYLLDPDRGIQRRALMLGKVVKLNRQTKEAMIEKARDLSNRAKDMLHEAQSIFDLDEDDLPELSGRPQRFS